MSSFKKIIAQADKDMIPHWKVLKETWGAEINEIFEDYWKDVLGLEGPPTITELRDESWIWVRASEYTNGAGNCLKIAYNFRTKAWRASCFILIPALSKVSNYLEVNSSVNNPGDLRRLVEDLVQEKASNGY